jgi:acetate kinase
VLIAHLGGGQSLCGTIAGQSVVTTMGFTPLDGLVMATRCGALDPGAVTWLARHIGAPEDLDAMLERESGLLALCGESDMRNVRDRIRRGDAEAQFAFEVWSRSLIAHSGGCIAVLGGLDALVFTGGIGEHDPIVRAALVDALDWLGVTIDEDANDRDEEEISAPGSRVRAFVIAAREDLQLAAEAEACIRPSP